MKALSLIVAIVCLFSASAVSEQAATKTIPAGSKIFIAPMEDGFHQYLKSAFQAKKVPLAIVDDKSVADFEISGHSETHKASTAKKVFLWDWRSNEQASIRITNLKTSEIVFAYAVNKVSSAHGRKSTAEACAKHVKEKIQSKQ